MFGSLRNHWPEYLMEAAGLAIFMISAGVFATIVEYPGSPMRQAISSPLLRRTVRGMAMGATAIGIIYSPWGKQSGAHINPSVTMAFFRLRKVEAWDAFFYLVAQFAGGLVGVLLVAAALGKWFADPAVHYVVTIPGFGGPIAAFGAELVISFGLMFLVLILTNIPRLARFTGVCAGALVTVYIIVEAPFSGMSMNPARTLGSALPASTWTAIWIYFTAPPLGMLAAAELYVRLKHPRRVLCAKLHHTYEKRCIFRCGYREEAFVSDSPGGSNGSTS